MSTPKQPIPLEIVDHVLLFLPPIVGLRCAIGMRRIAVRNVLVPAVSQASLEGACVKGSASLVAWWLDRVSRGSVMIPEERLTFCVDTLAQYGHVEILQLWKDSGVSFHASTAALDYAARNGHVDVFEFFLRNELTLSILNARHWALEKGRTEVIKWLEDHSEELWEYPWDLH